MTLAMSLTTRPAKSLLSTKRLDVLSKVDYVKERIHGINTGWGVSLYKEYLLATNPSGRFNENGSKFSIEDYFLEFDELIASFRTHGFDAKQSSLPLAQGHIENGAHRLAISVVKGLDVATQDTTSLPQIYDWDYLERIGLAEVYRDKIALNFVEANDNVAALLLTGMNDDEVAELVRRSKSIVDVACTRKVSLSEIGKRRLMGLAYGHNDWWEEKFRETMVYERFREGSQYAQATAIFYVLAPDASPRALKEHLRRALPNRTFERQIHGTDSKHEAVLLAQTLCNQNSRHFLNCSPIGSETNILQKVKGLDLPSDGTWAIDGSATLEMYGVRIARDVDLIVSKTATNRNAKFKNVDRHEQEYAHYPTSFESVIHDPRSHFYCEGVKFISLSALMQQKIYVGDEKGILDQKLTSEFLARTSPLYAIPPKKAPVSLWKLETRLARFLEPAVRVLPSSLERFVRRTLRNIRLLVESLLRV
jgi:hypothetical protein